MERIIKTKLNKDAAPAETHVVFDFEGVSEDELKELAVRALVIGAQATYRAAGSVPAEDRIAVAEVIHAKRVTGSPLTKAEKLVAKLTDAERAALLESLMK